LTQKSLKMCDYSLKLAIELETIFVRKVYILNEASQKSHSDSFGSLTHTMKEVQQAELEILQEIIKVITRLKQEHCNHPKKDRDVRYGVIYCRNCNLSLKSK